MTTTCTCCQSEFRASQALCEDWNDPQRSFGCPHCGTFYMGSRSDTVTFLQAAFVGLCFFGGVIIAVAFLFLYIFRLMVPDLTGLLFVIFAFALIGAGLRLRKSIGGMVVSPYRAQISKPVDEPSRLHPN